MRYCDNLYFMVEIFCYNHLLKYFSSDKGSKCLACKAHKCPYASGSLRSLDHQPGGADDLDVDFDDVHDDLDLVDHQPGGAGDLDLDPDFDDVDDDVDLVNHQPGAADDDGLDVDDVDDHS